jgi:hypothetical protein
LLKGHKQNYKINTDEMKFRLQANIASIRWDSEPGSVRVRPPFRGL